MKTALVAGASGIVGGTLVNHLLARDDWSVIGLSRGGRAGHPRLRLIAVDLTDPAQCGALAGVAGEITHVFYAARAARPSVAEENAANAAMLRHLLAGLLPGAPRLSHVTLVHGTKWYGSHLGPYRTPARERDPRHAGENFYFDQQDLLEELQRDGAGWRWSTVRPHIVCGLSIGYPFNFISTLGVYGSLCRALGRPLAFPGTEACYHSLSQATDADLLADAMIWTTQDRRCANQPFNIVNGDAFRWRDVWPSFAAFFRVEPQGPGGAPLREAMAGIEGAWTALTQQHGLRDIGLSRLANWTFGDFIFRADWDDMSSMVKARQAGFCAAVDSEDMFLRRLNELRDQRIIP